MKTGSNSLKYFLFQTLTRFDVRTTETPITTAINPVLRTCIRASEPLSSRDINTVIEFRGS